MEHYLARTVLPTLDHHALRPDPVHGGIEDLVLHRETISIRNSGTVQATALTKPTLCSTVRPLAEYSAAFPLRHHCIVLVYEEATICAITGDTMPPNPPKPSPLTNPYKGNIFG
jgi:hypothetical protein